MTPIGLVRVRITKCFVRLLSQAVFFSLVSPVFCIAAQIPGPQRVLVLYSDERLLPANVIFDHSFRTNLQAGVSRRIEFHSEFLDMARFSGEAQQERQRSFLREKYLDYPPDLIVAVSGAAVAFLMQYRASLFTEAPVVYLTWEGEGPPGDLPPDPKAAGISTPGRADATLSLALNLHPDTRHIAFVTGCSQRDKTLAEEARKASSAFENRVAFTWLTDLSLPELRDKLARLPDHTVVLYLTLFQDAAGNRFTPQEALDQFASASRAPIYGYYDTYLGHGIVGGSMVTFDEIGRKAAQAGSRILAGESPQAVARSEIQGIPMFDWGKLRRWNISEQRLPPASIVRFKEATYWEQHYRIIVTALVLCLLEGLLIVALPVQLHRRRKAEEALRERDQHIGLAASATELAIWTWDILRDQIWMTDKGRARGRALFGFAPDTRLDYAALSARVHPEDRRARDAVIRRALETQDEYAMEYRVLLPDGQVRWIDGRGRVEFGGGKPLWMRGISLDITERRQTELEVARQRNELAHAARLTIVGELTASIAHEINQPLGAILSNAETAELLLKSKQPHLEEVQTHLEEVQQILADIRKDDLRASEVIRRMRELLRKRELELKLIDLNAAASDVLRFVAGETHRQGVKIEKQFADNLPFVHGDVIHLQQVLLNLILNGMEAMSESSESNRRLTMRTAYDGNGNVEIAVEDAGSGIPPDRLPRLFDSFFTTKPHGMGLGLSIVRSIVEAHGGRIWAENNSSGGACFRFTLPVNGEA
jgi:PAS domain S-box-containing protein